MTIRLLRRHALPVATLTTLFTLLLASSPALAQRAQAPGQLQRADGSTTLGAEAPSNVTNLSYRGGDEVFLTHSASQEITPLTGIACSSAGSTTQNSYWRVFDLDDFDLPDGLTTSSIEVGIETANIFAAPPVSTVRLYELDGAFTTANLTLVAEAEYSIQDADDATIVTVPIEGSFSGGRVVAVEWDVPNLQDSGGGVFIGSNTQGQTGPTYVSAADCGLVQPTDLASIGFPDVAWVLNINGTAGGTSGGGGGGLEEAVHDTGDVQLEVFDFGEVGAYADADGIAQGTGFVFDGDNGLYESTFLVGVSPTQVSGDAYEFPDVEWVRTDSLRDATPPEGFDQAFSASYDDSASLNPIGVEVSQLSYSATDDDYVIVEFTVENTSGADLSEVYLGVFADWDAGDFEQNLGAYDEDQQLLYVYDDSGTSTNYFGVAALDGNTGVDVSGVFYDALPGDDILYTSLTAIAPDAELPDDRRTVLGVGPYDIAAGESVTVQFAYVGGTDEADILANAAAAQAAVAGPLEQAVHDTGTVEFEVFADGDLGTDAPAFEGTGFVFDGDNGLFTSQFVVGASQSQVSGSYYGTNTEWITTDPLAVAAPPADFDQAFSASFDDSGAANPIGLEVEQTSYSAAGDDYVIVSYDVENTSGADLEDIYLGVFADWDVGTFEQNLAGYDAESGLVYVYDDSGTSTNYFGVAALGDAPVSGVFYDALGGTETDDDIYFYLTTILPDPELVEDRRVTLGVGPYDIPAGEEITVSFAFVGGEDLDDIIANANAAQGNPVAVEESTPEGTFVLHSAYPNPFASSTTIGFTLPTAQDVRLTVYDVLGRRVATLIDGIRQSGDQTVTFDASSLPSGMYLYRLEAGGTQLTQRLTLLR